MLCLWLNLRALKVFSWVINEFFVTNLDAGEKRIVLAKNMLMWSQAGWLLSVVRGTSRPLTTLKASFWPNLWGVMTFGRLWRRYPNVDEEPKMLRNTDKSSSDTNCKRTIWCSTTLASAVQPKSCLIVELSSRSNFCRRRCHCHCCRYNS